MAPSNRQIIVEAPVGDGVLIHLRTLSISEWLTALRLGGDSDGGHTALRMSLLQIDGQPVTQNDLRGSGLKRHLPRTRQLVTAMRHWQGIHDVERRPHLVDQALESLKEVSAGRWTFLLPEHRQGLLDTPARRVEMVEVDTDTVRQAVEEASRGARSQVARQMIAIRNQMMASLVRIEEPVADGEPRVHEWAQGKVSEVDLDAHISVFDLMVLAAVWARIHVADDEGLDDLGNLQAISATSS